MDRILSFGFSDPKVERLLSVLRYEVVVAKDKQSLPALLTSEVIDLCLIDQAMISNAAEVIEFLREFDATKELPIVALVPDRTCEINLVERRFSKLEIIRTPIGPGLIGSKIATALRLRKMAGKQTSGGSLSEVNAALRDMQEHIERELAEARLIQQSLLPAQLPQHPGYSLSATYLPLHEVGGDWYYAETNPDGTVGIQVADVTGHGLSAAFIASMTKLAYSASTSRRPHELLGSMSFLLKDQMPDGRFVTMSSFMYNPVNGEVEIARAGHLPTMIYRKETHTVEQITGEGFALGFIGACTYKAESCTMLPGDVAILYTDGIVEAKNRNGEVFGGARLAETLANAAAETSTAEEIKEAIFKSFETFREERLLIDDITLIVLRRLQ